MKNSYSYYTDKLEGEYKSVFSDIETYGWTVDMDNILYEEKMSELLDIFINAQEENKAIDLIVGKDINSFCENFFSEVPKTSRIKEFFDTIKRLAWILVIFDGINFLLDLSEVKTATSDIGGLILIFIFTYVISRLVAIITRKFLYSKLKIKYKTRRSLIIATQLVCSIIIFIVAFANFKDVVVIPSYVEVGVAAVYLVVYYIFNYKRLKKDKQERGKAELIENTDISVEMLNKFEKLNKKRVKKGKTPLSMDEFAAQEEKITNKMTFIKKMYLIFPIPITIICFVITLLVDGFESNVDVVIFIAIMLGVEYLIMIPFYKLEGKMYIMRKRWQDNYYKSNNKDCTEEI